MANDSALNIIIIVLIILGIAIAISFVLKIKNLKAIGMLFSIILIMGYAFEVISQLYSFIAYIIVALIVYSEYSKNGGNEENA